TTVFGTTPVALAKAVKNPFEIEGMKSAHIRDGVAMVRFLHWLEKSVQAERRVSEWDAAVKLGEFRSEVSGYQGDSFETISAYGPGAALPHYVTPRGDAPLLEAHGLYLCDSGGQYLDGTTDITRTVPLGDLTPLEREDYTLVLKGHIDLAMALFPEGTPGCRIDALAREPLWRFKRNFGHGTGHGVGSFLGVHEGPQDVRQNLNPQPLVSGMVISDEPGIYREGQHGVRHENLLLCVPKGENEFGRWLGFEPLTLCPFDTAGLDLSLLDRAEKEWLDEYHALVYETLSPLLDDDLARWLQQKCRKIVNFAN
ncbi:MAG: M24 family metallopeptidase, partial [Bacteroidales bacterium]|nr:M24 family metallopeptidase [Bacteroidales bacterium]